MRSRHPLPQLGLTEALAAVPGPRRAPLHGSKAGAQGLCVSRAGDVPHVIPAGQGLAPPATAPGVPAAAPRPWAAPSGVTAAGNGDKVGRQPSALESWHGLFPAGEG